MPFYIFTFSLNKMLLNYKLFLVHVFTLIVPSALFLSYHTVYIHMEIALCNTVVPCTMNIRNADVAKLFKKVIAPPYYLTSPHKTTFLFGEHLSRSFLCLLDTNAKRTSSSLDCLISYKQSV